MNNNKIIALVVIALLVGLPFWRIQSNSKYFVEGVMGHLGTLGEWKHSQMESSLDGEIRLKRLTFIPAGKRQGYQIDSMRIHADVWDLLLKDSRDLVALAPHSLGINLYGVRFNGNGNDLVEEVYGNNFWPLVAGHLGSFACGEGENDTFSQSQWQTMYPGGLSHDIEITYQLSDALNIDFSVNVQTSDAWYITWSGSLTRSSDVPRITFNDTIVDTLYYYHADQGFNIKRNEMCAKKHRNSFAAFRLDSANQLQQLLRALVAKDMPEKLNNLYQRSLAAESEVNAILKLDEPKYMFELAGVPQNDILAASSLEVALGENEYEKVELKAIDHLDLNMDLLRLQMEAQEKKAEAEAEANKPKELIKVITHQIGKQKSSNNLTNWNDAIGKNVRIKTKRGRPIFGKLMSMDAKQLTVSTRYMSGNATLTVPRHEVMSVGLSN
ncbi:hypothetical protein [Marinicella rhabdoformis]|uniref:hypothetical protein n=1 Tax=Marinicella rhabdoformis TaxID=2580566 RepID=UPI0012AECE7F|nr:hypothetical protein [Marinicella rhabdoformis]